MPNKNPNKNKDKSILVTGATGHQGGAAMRHLREKGFPVRALTRDPDQPRARGLTGHGVEVVRGDMEDQKSLTRVLEDDVHGVYSVQNSHAAGIEGEIRQGTRLADAAALQHHTLRLQFRGQRRPEDRYSALRQQVSYRGTHPGYWGGGGGILIARSSSWKIGSACASRLKTAS